jgi:hypothetical protein
VACESCPVHPSHELGLHFYAKIIESFLVEGEKMQL